MAESILLHIAQSLVDKLFSLVSAEVSLVWGVKTDLRKLKDKIVSIGAVIADAELKQSSEQKLRVWLDDLREVLYDSENVLDEFECEALRKRVFEEGNLSGKVGRYFTSSNPLIFRIKMGHKIRDIMTRLEEIATRKDEFNLNQQTDFGRVSRSGWRETHSHVNALEVIGRDDERDQIIERLLRAEKNPFVVSIVGIGGMGKTALAKLVYNEDRIKRHFELRMWVCVSEEFDMRQILQKIILSAVQENINILEPTTIPNIHLLEVQQLQDTLVKLLKEKKFLLVLDDVWSENQQRWSKLRGLLTGGAAGSSVILTTRSSKVSSAAISSYEHMLKGLSHQICMTLFHKRLEDRQVEATDQVLLDILRQIAGKCGGVPLVVNALGGLLASKTDIGYWVSIRDRDILSVLQNEEDIVPILKLSYDHLPAHLKRCFEFCSLFPKDYEFSSIILFNYWIAAGLINTSDNNRKAYDMCHQYLSELVARSLFQDFREYGGISTFRMHDLVHDLALSVACADYAVVKSDTLGISSSVRNVLFSNGSSNQTVCLPPFLSRSKKLQTFIWDSSEATIEADSLEALISNCQYLRILVLKFNFEVLPSNVDRLKHLRYLNLYDNIKIKRLPESICKLQNLQTLHLSGCESLEELPRGMRKLVNLRTLSITTKQRSLRSNGIEYLKSLHTLEITGCNRLESPFEGMDMEGLASLRHLSIEKCESLTSIPMTSVKLMASLEVLQIIACTMLDLSMEEIFPSRLRVLSVHGLQNMLKFPNWIQGAADTLQYVGISDCNQLQELPEWLHRLSCLATLQIYRCPSLSSLPNGFQNLTALRSLDIDGCDDLSARCRPNGQDWPMIKHIPNIEIEGEKIFTK